MKLTANEALNRVKVNTNVAELKSSNMKLARTIKRSGKDAIYMFKNGENVVFAPAVSNAVPILGTCVIRDEHNLPPALIDMLNEYALGISVYQDENEDDDPVVFRAPSNSNTSTSSTETVVVEPLITSKWNQEAPYNNDIMEQLGDQVPVKPGTNERLSVPCGCNATAMAQVIYYWAKKGYRRGCTSLKRYITSKNKWEVSVLPPIEEFDFDNMIDNPCPWNKKKKKPEPVYTEEQGKAISKLIQYAACSVKMNFDVDSSTSNVHTSMTALIKNFEFGDFEETQHISVINYKNADRFVSEEEFETSVKESLDSKCPVLMVSNYHCYICDGYKRKSDGKLYFHFNWGWGDLIYDSWCVLTYILYTKNDKSRYDYTARKQAVVNLRPKYPLYDVNKDGYVNMSDIGYITRMVANKQYSNAADVNNDGVVDSKDIQSVTNHVLGKSEE